MVAQGNPVTYKSMLQVSQMLCEVPVKHIHTYIHTIQLKHITHAHIPWDPSICVTVLFKNFESTLQCESPMA